MKQSELVDEVKTFCKEHTIFSCVMTAKILFDIAQIIYLLVK